MKEREISIVDLIVEILLHWRMFIIWMIVGAVFFGAFSYVRSDNAVKQQQAQTDELEKEPEERLTDEEIENVKYAVEYEKVYREQKAYVEESELMQLDSNCVNRAEATIAVDGGMSRKSYDIEKVYEDILVSGELLEKVAKETGMKVTDVSEMLFLSEEKADSVTIGEAEGIATLRISAVHSDEAYSKKMLETAIAFLTEKKSDVEKSLGEHELFVVNESFGTVADKNIAQEQIERLNDLATIRKTLTSAMEELSETEKSYYDYLVYEENPEETATSAEILSPSISKKYVLLGAVMAAFLYAFILLLIYIFNTKLRATDNLQELYDIPQLGMIPLENGHKKFLGVIDKWILSIRNRNKRQFTIEEALELASVAAKMAAGKEELHEICLIGCGLKDQSLKACEKIKAGLEKENIHINILNNVLYDARMMEELEKAEGAVLVESAGSTLYNEVAEELELLKRQGIKVLGGVLIG